MFSYWCGICVPLCVCSGPHEGLLTNLPLDGIISVERRDHRTQASGEMAGVGRGLVC